MNVNQQLDWVLTELRKLSDRIDTATNSDDEIDHTYLLEAVQADIELIRTLNVPGKTQELIDNPVS